MENKDRFKGFSRSDLIDVVEDLEKLIEAPDTIDEKRKQSGKDSRLAGYWYRPSVVETYMNSIELIQRELQTEQSQKDKNLVTAKHMAFISGLCAVVSFVLAVISMAD